MQDRTITNFQPYLNDQADKFLCDQVFADRAATHVCIQDPRKGLAHLAKPSDLTVFQFDAHLHKTMRSQRQARTPPRARVTVLISN